MSYTKTIVCLANSRKYAGRCVAGKEWDGSTFTRWIRPVSDTPDGALSVKGCRLAGGRDPALLDVVTVGMIEPRPQSYQSENHVVDLRVRWEKKGYLTRARLDSIVDHAEEPLWLNADGPDGPNDRVPEAKLAALHHSLMLIKPGGCALEVVTDGVNLKRRVWAAFDYGGVRYRLSVTDLAAERKYLMMKEDRHELPEVYLCVSLGELYNGHAYKLVAALITPDMARTK